MFMRSGRLRNTQPVRPGDEIPGVRSGCRKAPENSSFGSGDSGVKVRRNVWMLVNGFKRALGAFLGAVVFRVWCCSWLLHFRKG